MNRNRGPAHHRWKGGTREQSGGYTAVLVRGHPRGHRGYVLEHVLIAERALGRFLPDGVEVHHVNRVRKDNRSVNLVVCQDRSYHQLLHRRQRALDACGNASAHRCTVCKGYDRQEDITSREGSAVAYHRSCNATYQRQRNARIRK